MLQAISGSALVGLSELAPAARKLPYFDPIATAALTDLSDIAHTLLAGVTGTAIYGTLGVAPDASMPTRLGTGGKPLTSNNYNLALGNGFYRGAGDASISPPPGSARFGALLVFGLNGQRVTQIATYADQMFYRGTADFGATWTAWDIFTPAKTTTGSGTTIRLPGRICTSPLITTLPSSAIKWTYPTVFSAAPSTQISPRAGVRVLVIYAAENTNDVTVYGYDAGVMTQYPVEVSLTATGSY